MKKLFNEHVELTHNKYWLIHSSKHFVIAPGTHLSVTATLKYWLSTYWFEEPVYKINCRCKAVKKSIKFLDTSHVKWSMNELKENQSSKKIFNGVKIRTATTALSLSQFRFMSLYPKYTQVVNRTREGRKVQGTFCISELMPIPWHKQKVTLPNLLPCATACVLQLLRAWTWANNNCTIQPLSVRHGGKVLSTILQGPANSEEKWA